MIDQNESSIFRLEVDEVSKSHMLEMARWGKFIAIVGFIMIGLMLLGGAAASMSSVLLSSGFLGGIGGVGIFLFYLLGAALFFYPTYMLFSFARNIKPALNTMNKEQFNSAFASLKNMFKYWGVMTIIILSLYGIVIIFLVIGLSR